MVNKSRVFLIPKCRNKQNETGVNYGHNSQNNSQNILNNFNRKIFDIIDNDDFVKKLTEVEAKCKIGDNIHLTTKHSEYFFDIIGKNEQTGQITYEFYSTTNQNFEKYKGSKGNLIEKDGIFYLVNNGKIVVGPFKNIKNLTYYDYSNNSQIENVSQNDEKYVSIAREISKKENKQFKKSFSKIDLNEIESNGIYPKRAVEIGGQKFLLTDKIEDGHVYVIGYVDVGGKYEARLFYYSQSGQNWHCSPGFKTTEPFNNELSKGEFANLNYEKGTVVNDILQKELGLLPNYGTIKNFDNLYGGLFETILEGYEVILISSETQKRFIEENPVEIYDEKNFADFADVRHIVELENLIANLDMKGFDDYKNGFRNAKFLGTYSKKIDYGKGKKNVTINRIQTTYKGEPIEIQIAKEDGNQNLWIENIFYNQSGINSFGLPGKSFNGGLLTTKPFEHKEYCPNGINKTIYNIGEDEYHDIRPYIQGNPLIVGFKNRFQLG